jgi:hypothetical protein
MRVEPGQERQAFIASLGRVRREGERLQLCPATARDQRQRAVQEGPVRRSSKPAKTGLMRRVTLAFVGGQRGTLYVPPPGARDCFVVGVLTGGVPTAQSERAN